MNLHCGRSPLRSRSGRLYGMLALTAALLAGCGDKGPELVPVAGKVTLNGQPVTQGSIQFIPQEQRAAYGEIGSDGGFKLMTDDKPGAVKGSHKVVVTAQEITGDESTGETMRRLVPEKYESVESTDLLVTIDGPQENLQIELTGQP